jgi:hypothetical protein
VACQPSQSAERELADLCRRKAELDGELKALRAQIRVKARDVTLPIVVDCGDAAVLVKKPQYTGGMPQVTVADLVR